jgi:hypothetical protein
MLSPWRNWLTSILPRASSKAVQRTCSVEVSIEFNEVSHAIARARRLQRRPLVVAHSRPRSSMQSGWPGRLSLTL